jgi:hypothetical protein
VYQREFILGFRSTATQIPANLVKVDHVFCSTPFGSADDGDLSLSGSRGEQLPRPAVGGDRWVAPTANESMTFIIDEDQKRAYEFEKRVRKVQGFLNRLTEENYDSLSQKILSNLQNSIDNVFLTEVTNHVFDKAISEPAYATMWGQLCTSLAQNFKSNAANSFNFRAILLSLCQAEFHRSLQQAMDEAKAQETKSSRPPLSEDEQADEEEMLFKRKRRRLGNICFIGELFLRELLASRVITTCVNDLIRIANDLSASLVYRIACVELFCKLLTITGSALEQNPKTKVHLDNFFERITPLIAAKDRDTSLPTRIRFMLEALVSRRTSGWSDRRSRPAATPAGTAAATPSSSTPTPTQRAPAAPSSEAGSSSGVATLSGTTLVDLVSAYCAHQDLERTERSLQALKLADIAQFSQLISEAVLVAVDNIQRLPLIVRLISHLVQRTILLPEHIVHAAVSLILSLDSLKQDFGSIAEKNLAIILRAFLEHQLFPLAALQSSPLFGANRPRYSAFLEHLQ